MKPSAPDTYDVGESCVHIGHVIFAVGIELSFGYGAGPSEEAARVAFDPERVRVKADGALVFDGSRTQLIERLKAEGWKGVP